MRLTPKLSEMPRRRTKQTTQQAPTSAIHIEAMAALARTMRRGARGTASSMRRQM